MKTFFISAFFFLLVACDSGSDGGTLNKVPPSLPPPPIDPESGLPTPELVPAMGQPELSFDKTSRNFIVSWHLAPTRVTYDLCIDSQCGIKTDDAKSGELKLKMSDDISLEQLLKIKPVINFYDENQEVIESHEIEFTQEIINSTIQYIKASDSTAEDKFGYSVDISEDGKTLAVGAPGKNVNALNDAGAVYIFTDTEAGWQQTDILTFSDAQANDNFGATVSLDAKGLTLAVAASKPNEVSGVVVLFHKIKCEFKQSQCEEKEHFWQQQEHVHHSNFDNQFFAQYKVALSDNGENFIVYSSRIRQSSYIELFSKVEGVWRYSGQTAVRFPGSYDTFGQTIATNQDASVMTNGFKTEYVGYYVEIKKNQGYHGVMKKFSSSENLNLDFDLKDKLSIGIPEQNKILIFNKPRDDNYSASIVTDNPLDNGYFGAKVKLDAKSSKVAIYAKKASSNVGISLESGEESSQNQEVTLYQLIEEEWVKMYHLQPLYSLLDANNTPNLPREAMSFSGDGKTLVLGMPNDGSKANGINSEEHENQEKQNSGAVWVFHL